MNAMPKHKLTLDEFLAWSETLPNEAGRYELWDGEIIEKRGPTGSMNSARSQHWVTKDAMYRALYSAVKDSGLLGHVATEGPTVRLSPSRGVEPDVLVYFGPKVPRDVLEVPNPAIVVEVLSPSTAKVDLSWKLQGYFTLASVQHYLIIDPDQPLIIHHRRGDGETILTNIITTPNLRLDPPGLDVDLTEVLAST
jgi:Uma2 family endonuclease